MSVIDASLSPSSKASLQLANENQSEAIEAKAFYGKGTVGITNELTAFEGKIRTEKPAQRNCRILSQPYSIPGPSADRTKAAAQTPPINSQSNAVKYAMPVPCTVQMVSIDRFEVVPSKYHGPLIDVFKKIPTRRYGKSKIKSNNLISFIGFYLHSDCPQMIKPESGHSTSKTMRRSVSR